MNFFFFDFCGWCISSTHRRAGAIDRIWLISSLLFCVWEGNLRCDGLWANPHIARLCSTTCLHELFLLQIIDGWMLEWVGIRRDTSLDWGIFDLGLITEFSFILQWAVVFQWDEEEKMKMMVKRRGRERTGSVLRGSNSCIVVFWTATFYDWSTFFST